MNQIILQSTGNLKPMKINQATIRQYCSVSKSLKAAWKWEEIDYHTVALEIQWILLLLSSQLCTFLESVFTNVGI